MKALSTRVQPICANELVRHFSYCAVINRQRINASGCVSSKAHPTPRIQKHDSAIDALYQQGSARIRFPHSPPGALQAVLLNTAGGLTGDDHIHWSVSAGTQSRLSVSTAACEKIYRTHGPAAVQTTEVDVASGARLDWLPQETIVFNGASLSRTLTAQIALDAQALFVESLVFGRQAMNEMLHRVNLHDQWRLFRGGKLLHAEDLRLCLNDASNAQQQGVMHHFGAIATLVLISNLPLEALEYKVAALRGLIPHEITQVAMAASTMEHRLVLRLLAIDSYYLRKFLIPCIELLSEGAPIPPVWKV